MVTGIFLNYYKHVFKYFLNVHINRKKTLLFSCKQHLLFSLRF